MTYTESPVLPTPAPTATTPETTRAAPAPALAPVVPAPAVDVIVERVEALQAVGDIGAHGGQVEVGLVEKEVQAQQFADASGGVGGVGAVGFGVVGGGHGCWLSWVVLEMIGIA